MNALRGFVASAGAIALGLALASAGCDSMFVQPADTGTGGLTVSFSVALHAGGNAQAFDRADAARIRLQRRNGGAVVVDRVVALAPNAVGREASVEVEVTEDPEVFDLSVELSAGGQALFAGTAAVTVRQGQATTVELPMQPVVASVVFPGSPVTLTAINQTLTLEAFALYATGDTARSVAVHWASQNQDIVTVTPGGVLTARAEGQTHVIATAGAASAALQVRVQATVSSVTVSPARDTLTVGEEVQLSAVARDANGTHLARTPAWQSSNAGVASVDAGGRVRAISAGTATITATVEGQVGSSVIVVLLPPVRTVTVLPATATVQVGSSVQLRAELRTAAGMLVTRPVQWSASNAAVASVSGNGLVLGVAPGVVTITATSEGASGTAQVSVVSPVLSVSPASLSFTGVPGGSNPASQALTIGNTGGGTLEWSVSGDAAWLSVSPASGTNTGTVTASVNIAGLIAGTYNANITITGNASNSPRTVPVTLTMVPGPQLAVSPTSLAFTAPQGGIGPASQALSISNSGGGTLSWSVADSAAWLFLGPLTGTNAGNVTVSVNTTGLLAGTYTANITITGNASNSPRTVPVTLTITAVPLIGVSPTSLSFTGIEGGANPSPRTLSISNAGSGTLSWSVSGVAGWLSLGPTSGTNSGAVTVSVSTAGLAAGTYNANITVTGNASNSPRTVPVTLTVVPPAIINVSPTALIFTGVQGGADPASQTVYISNAGTGTLYPSYTGTSTPWLTLMGTSVLTMPPRLVSVTASVSTAGLAAGTYSAAITISGNASNSPVTVPVTLTMVPAATTGQIGGRVANVTGAPIAGATVTVVGTTRSALTSADGSFLVTGLVPGWYAVSASAPGYLATTTSEQYVAAGQTTTFNLTLGSLPSTPVPPVLSAGSASVWTLNDTGCSLYGPTRLGTSFRVVFSFSDADGDVPLSSSAVGGSWVFYPSGASGGVSGTYRYQPTVTGSGSSGTVTTYQCYVFGSDSYVDVTMTMTDAGGRTGTLAPIRIGKPAGAN